MKKKAFLFLTLSFFGLGILYELTVVTVPRTTPLGVTRKRMCCLEILIEDFVLLNKRIPDDLQFVRTNQTLSHLAVDGWGFPIQYEIRGKKVILTSRGDGKEPSLEWQFSVADE